MSRGVEKTALQAASLFGLILCVLTGIWAWQAGLLTSQERLQAFVASCGAAGGLLFVAFQMVQVVVPVLPGGLGCLVGVVLFGPVMGFVYNYVGICIGSLLAFAVARNCGRPLLSLLFSEKLIAKYSDWTERNDRFARLFALAIFFPVAPDDFLCYLAGTTSMTWRRFTTIILLGKPLSIALYSLGLTVLFESFAEPLLLMFGASENTIGYALDYMRIYALGTIFVQLTLGMNAYITAQGFATVSMKTVLIGALLNTALDPLFISALGLGSLINLNFSLLHFHPAQVHQENIAETLRYLRS